MVGGMSELNAQVTIGSSTPPNKNALLDLQEHTTGKSDKGLLLPRVELEATNLAKPLTEHTEGMTVYNTVVSPGTVSAEYYVSPGLYYNDGTKWERLHLGASNWFYMPSVSFDTTLDASGVEINLYDLYKAQFSVPVKGSAGAPVAVPYIPAATDLYYYITAADPAVFTINSISNAGLMNYDVKAAATDCSYINIVFVLK